MPPANQQIILSESQWGSNFKIRNVPDHTRETVIRILKKIYRTLWSGEKGNIKGKITRKQLFATDSFYLLGTHRFYIPQVDIGLDKDHKTVKEIYSSLIKSRTAVECIPMTRYFYYVSKLRHEKKKALVGMGIERASAFVPGGDFAEMGGSAQTAFEGLSGASDLGGSALGYRDAARGVSAADRLIKTFLQKSPARPGSPDEFAVNGNNSAIHSELGGALSFCILEFDGNVIKFCTTNKHTFQSHKDSTVSKNDPYLFNTDAFQNKLVTYLRVDANGDRMIEVDGTTRHVDL